MQDSTIFHMLAPPSFHAKIFTRAVLLGENAPHEAVPREPLEDPAVRVAVRNMLGPFACPDGCAHIHANLSTEPGPWHVDDYCGSEWPAGKRFAILCYFPQDTTVEMGPTAIRSGGIEITGAGPAGTCLLMRQDVEHRAEANTSGMARIMLKYLFVDDK